MSLHNSEEHAQMAEDNTERKDNVQMNKDNTRMNEDNVQIKEDNIQIHEDNVQTKEGNTQINVDSTNNMKTKEDHNLTKELPQEQPTTEYVNTAIKGHFGYYDPLRTIFQSSTR
ncbi:hypothetical protein M422DRAFT_253043 [Sphaerobolus stellatus SS14]|uniref:Uncharacterized protein n=1 Tax=Sphaerobolus stellatus (strain SS14) TaxID=990650 RepID=A0A0C9VND6_SPHS4|nr:hypothetical protein M422DRAFT_253043 [Sphaerobolus stellatus SS14]